MVAKNAPQRYAFLYTYEYYKAAVRQLPGGSLEDILSTIDISGLLKSCQNQPDCENC